MRQYHISVKDLSQVNPAMIEYCTKNPAPKGFDPEVGDFCFGQFSEYLLTVTFNCNIYVYFVNVGKLCSVSC